MGNELVFRAADTATALEKVQDNLGENAFIIEIKNVGNFVEITASLQEPAITKGGSKAAPKKSVLVLSQQLRENSKLKSQGNLDEPVKLGKEDEPSSILAADTASKIYANTVQDVHSNEKVVDVSDQLQASNIEGIDTEIGNGSSVSHQSLKSQRNETINVDAGRGQSAILNADPTHERVEEKGVNADLSFGDLLNLGLTSEYIKKEFPIAEFSGSISRDELVSALVKTFWDPNSPRILDVYYNIVLLGTPGAGKSTVCAKLMQHYSLFKDERPNVLRVSPDKLFELERLSFFARLFNFQFEKQSDFQPEIIFNADKQLSEISWDYFCDFFQALTQQSRHLPHVKLLLVLPASINTASLTEVLRISRGVSSIIVNKCDYGRITMKHLMMLYEQKCKIVGLSGDTDVTQPMEFVDEATMRAFVEYVLDMSQ